MGGGKGNLQGCRHCGNELKRGIRFCPSCGHATNAGHKHVASVLEKERSLHRRAVSAIAIIFMGVIAAMLAGAHFESNGTTVQSLLMLLVGGIALGILGWPRPRVIFGSRPSLLDFGLAAIAGLIAFVIAWLYVLGLWTLQDIDPDEIEGLALAWWSLVVVAPLVEEFLIRGVAWEALIRIRTPKSTLLVSSILFAMIHGLNGGFWLEYPHRFAGGLVIGFVRLKTGSLLPCIVAHMVWNGIAVFGAS
jgi:membrane protease YdiL (CAAX protease family)